MEHFQPPPCLASTKDVEGWNQTNCGGEKPYTNDRHVKKNNGKKTAFLIKKNDDKLTFKTFF